MVGANIALHQKRVNILCWFYFCGGCAVVSVVDCQSLGSRFKSGQKFGSRFLLHLCPLANSAMMSTLTTHRQWEEVMVRERTGHSPSYAEAKKMKSLKPHTHQVKSSLVYYMTNYKDRGASADTAATETYYIKKYYNLE